MDLTPSERDTMREMTVAELQGWYMGRRFPCCQGTEYERGPSGGISINLRCPRCDMRINVVDPDSAWARAGMHIGQVIREPVVR
jgi:hypothetical protein